MDLHEHFRDFKSSQFFKSNPWEVSEEFFKQPVSCW